MTRTEIEAFLRDCEQWKNTRCHALALAGEAAAEQLKEAMTALEEIAAIPPEREANDLHFGPTMYPTPVKEAQSIARRSLSRWEAP